MKPCLYTVLMISLAAMFLAGCSIRTVPLEEEQLIYEDEVGIYDSLPPGFLYEAWQLSQYRQYYGDASELGYRMNIDPNPHDSYRAGEKPIQRAPAQTSIQGTTPNRRVRERQEVSSTQRTVTRSRTRSNRIASESTDDRRRVRAQLRQRPRQRTTNAVDDEDRKSQRRTTRRRARR
ncbi:hypothetical protein J4G02_17585 [Candidatus Poribacteria bacterium]|nr:hypothetical protein [Candidatus Poribacteria bacterium]